MIEKTEAIVLRITPYSKTSQVVSWLTGKYGRLVTVAKGACRPKSAFLGQYDLFYTCEVLFYHREHNPVHILKECSPVQTRSIFRENWKAMLCASYLCDLVSRVSTEGHSQPELYDLLESSLNYLSTGNAKPQFLAWFELRLMKMLGMAPQLTSCHSCRQDLSASGPMPISFSPASGSIRCQACTGKHGEPVIPVTPDTLAMLRHWQKCDTAIAAGNTKITEKQLVALRKILGRFLDYHLDFVPLSRSIAMDTIQETTAGGERSGIEKNETTKRQGEIR